MSQAQTNTEDNLGLVRTHALLHLLTFIFAVLAVIQALQICCSLNHVHDTRLPVIYILLADTYLSHTLILYRNKYWMPV